MTTETESKVIAQATTMLVGRKVVRVRYMSAEETEELFWSQRGIVLEFDNGTLAYTSGDEEANDAGVLWVQSKQKEVCCGRLPA